MQRHKRSIANALWTVGILFWAIPVAFTQAIANLSTIEDKAPWVPTPEEGTAAYSIIQGVLPVVALAILMFLVPLFITMSAVKFWKAKSQPEVDTYLFKWHFGFQVCDHCLPASAVPTKYRDN